MAELGRYPYEVEGIADEIGDLLDGDLFDAAVAAIAEIGMDAMLDPTPEERGKSIAFLASTPSQRAKKLARMDDRTAAVLAIRARYAGLLAFRAMTASERFENIPGMGYRRAAEFAARIAFAAEPLPTMDDVLPGWDDADYHGPDI